VGHALLDFAFPPHCLVCGQFLGEAGQSLCGRCWGEIQSPCPDRCPRCSCPGAISPCANCASWDPAVERALVLGDFAGALREAIHLLKFQGHQELGRCLGRCLGQAPELARALQQVDLLIPVPLHPARQRERGYNQSLRIAEGLAEALGKRLCADRLERRVPTRQQARLDAAARQQNLEAAFQVKGELPAHCCIGLVDDVVTTGATLGACGRALYQAGGRRVWGVALACPFQRGPSP